MTDLFSVPIATSNPIPNTVVDSVFGDFSSLENDSKIGSKSEMESVNNSEFSDLASSDTTLKAESNTSLFELKPDCLSTTI
jgi:hypothetical protein